MADEKDGNSQASDAATELQLSLSSKRVSKASTTFAALTEVEDSDVEQEAAPESQQSSAESEDVSKAEGEEDFHQHYKTILRVLFGQYQPLERARRPSRTPMKRKSTTTCGGIAGRRDSPSLTEALRRRL